MKTDSYIPYSNNQLTKKGGCGKNKSNNQSKKII